MHKFLIIFCLFLAGGAFGLQPLQAQEAQEAEGTLLPDIDPQDIEIRSQYRARFPGLSRQPILGFTPGSRVFQVDPNRRPYFEDLDEIAAQLPVGALSRPDAPEYAFFPYADRQRGYGRIGFGSFISPEAELYLAEEISGDQWLSGGLNYISADGHLDQRSSFRNFDFDTNYRGKVGERSLMAVYLGGQSGFNYMVSPEGLNVSENPGRKTVSNFHAGTRFKRYRSSVEYLELGLEGHLGQIDLTDEPFGFSNNLFDWGVSLDGGYTWAGRRMNELFSMNVDLQTGGYELDMGGSDGWHLAGLNGRYSRLFNYRTQLNLTLGIHHGSDAVESSRIYFSPDLSIEHSFSDHVTLSAHFSGQPEQTGHIQHHRFNRFLMPENLLRNSYHLKAVSQLMVEPIAGNQIRMGVSYQNTENYSWYRRAPLITGTQIVPGHYMIEYDDVTIPKAFAGLGVDLIRERVWFDVEGYLQTPQISDDQPIPFIEEYGLNGGLTIRPVDILLFEVWGNFVGPRMTPADTELPAYLDFGTKLELRITERIGIYGKIQNLLNQEYEIWEGYIERPFQAYGGITLHL